MAEEDRTLKVLAAIITTMSLSTVFVASRIVSKFYVVRRGSLDDYLIIISWVIAMCASASLIYGTTVGLGKHTYTLSPSAIIPFRASIYAFTILYSPAIMFAKLSFLVFYRSIARKAHQIIYRSCLVIMVVVVLTGIAMTFTLIFQCRPVKYVFSTGENHSTKCIGLVTIYLVAAPVYIAADVALLLAPLPLLTGLRLPLKQKIVLISMFVIGGFATVIDIIRLYYLQQASYYSTGELVVKEFKGAVAIPLDLGWYGASSFMWSSVEVHTSIVCACIPTIKPLIEKILPRLIYSRSDGISSQQAKMIVYESHPTPPFERPNPLSQTSKSQLEKVYIAEEDDAPRFPPTPSSETSTPPFTWWRDPRKWKAKELRARASISLKARAITFNFQKPPALTDVRGKQTIKYCFIMAILYMFWGFSFFLVNALNTKFAVGRMYSTERRLALITVYFGGYLLGPLTLGLYSLNNFGFKMTSLIGLCINAVGMLIIWPSSILGSYYALAVSDFFCGFGLGILETGADAFVVLCGPMAYAEVRFTLAQSIWPLAGMVSVVVMNQGLFPNNATEISAWTLQWVYLGLFFVSMLLVLLYYYIPLPDAKDEDFERRDRDRSIRRPVGTREASRRTMIVTFAMGICAQFFFTGTTEIFSSSAGAIIADRTIKAGGMPTLSPNQYVLITCGVGFLSRVVTAALCLFIKPRIIMLVCFVCLLIICSVAATLESTGNTLTIIFYFYIVFQYSLWPLSYSLTLQGAGRHTKTVAALLTTGQMGSGLWIWLSYIAVKFSSDLRVILWACLTLNTIAMIFPFYLSFWEPARKRIDSYSLIESKKRRKGRSASRATISL